MRDGKTVKPKKSNKEQLNTRVPAYLMPIIAAGARASGISQAEYIEMCVMTNDEKVIEMSAEERALHLDRLRNLKNEAKAKKIFEGKA